VRCVGQQVKPKPSSNGERSLEASPLASASPRASHGSAPSADATLDEIEAVARIGSYSTDLTAGRWVSSKSLDAIFGIDAAFERSVEGWTSLIHPADREAMVAYFTDEVLGRARPFDRQYRIVRADTGEERWVHGRGALELDASGRPVRMVGTIADVTEQVVAERERTRLGEGLRMSERNLAEAQRISHIGSWEWDLATDTAQRSDELHRIYGVEPGTIPGTTEAFLAFVHPDDRARVQASERAAITGAGQYALDYRAVRPDGSIRNVQDRAEVVRDPSGVPVRMIGTVQDVTEQVAAEADRTRLVSAIDQTAESVWMQDLDNIVTYVNRAFSRTYGYEPGEIVGRHAGIVDSGRQEPAFFAELWASVASGRTWTGSIVNRRKDGTLFEVEAVISGIRDAAGRHLGYMQTDRDVTRERALEGALARRARERDMIEAALERIDSGSTPEVIAAVACAEMIGLPNVDSAFVIALDGEDHGLVLGVEGLVAVVFAASRILPGPRAHYLWERASVGIWTEKWRARSEDGTYGEQVAATGLHTVAYAPLRGPSGVIGVVGFATHGPTQDDLVEELPVLTTLASLLGTLLSPGLEARYREDDARASVQAILDTAAFIPFFQPIVDLHSGAVVGYEALSRFADGIPPDAVFALAVRAGLGIELETATLGAALEAAANVPPEAYLSLNISPGLLRSGTLRALLGGRERGIVLEITEHVVIEDYPALRRELAALGPNVRLAVDDAGAGYASLRHILELAPDFVKLDIGLIRGIDSDPARQALIAGMGYFALKRKIGLVAEGIETAAELKALRGLGIGYGQGYLFGRPQDGRGPGPWPTKVALGHW
jgi:PAS domain S-box-containing protein